MHAGDPAIKPLKAPQRVDTIVHSAFHWALIEAPDRDLGDLLLPALAFSCENMVVVN
jgi:hypothetical protein